ncbi:MAG TPA: peptidyl-prolyl cis-trans isomerase [Verrucomicrobiae bacterium]|nr:peptidyl-prolyl cis-trans isomerase [Verrucomicrobiae bacterium]
MTSKSLLAALGLSIAVAAFGPGAPPARADIIEEVAAFVNGQILTRSEIADREAQIRQQLTRQFAGDDLEAKIAEARKNLLTDMIRELLLVQRAEILGLDLDKVYQQAIDNLKEQQGIKTNDEMSALLKQEGLTQDELRKTLLRYNVPDIMINLEVRQKLVVTDEELKAYFDKHREEFRVEESYKIREIVLLSDGHTDPELDALSAQIKAELAAGTPFAELVLKYSEAPSRFQEGLVGPMSSADLSPTLRAAVEKMKPGDVSDPVAMPHGIHLIQLDTKTDAKEPDFEAVKTGIENKIKQEKFQAALEDYWQKLYRENRINIPEKYRAFALGVPSNSPQS